MSPKTGYVIDTVLPYIWIGSGLLSENPILYFQGASIICMFLSCYFIFGATCFYYLGKKYPFDICQDKRQQSVDLMFYEIYGVFRCTLSIGLIGGHVYSAMMSGKETLLSWDFEECHGTFGPKAIAHHILQTIIVWIMADLWTYNKHYCLHRWFFPLHKEHHTFHDPTPLASFSLGFGEAFWTFGLGLQYILVPITENPFGKLYFPTHFGQIFCFLTLNLYMHCGYNIPVIEAILPCFGINTSAFHNVHHEKTHCNYGEVSPFIDLLIGTYDHVKYNKYNKKYTLKNVFCNSSPNKKSE